MNGLMQEIYRRWRPERYANCTEEQLLELFNDYINGLNNAELMQIIGDIVEEAEDDLEEAAAGE